jgi:large subunit ribosomal protein L10
VTEPAANDAVAEVPAQAATTEAVVVTEETTPEVVAEVAEVPAAEATEASTETEEKE